MAAQYPWHTLVVHPAYVCFCEMPPGQTVQVAFDSLSVPPFFRSAFFFLNYQESIYGRVFSVTSSPSAEEGEAILLFRESSEY